MKKILIFGSSVAFGQGAKHFNGWAAMLKSELESKNYEIINCSVCGDNSKLLLKRVKQDVISLKPYAVVIAISLGNEGLAHSFKQQKFNRFLKNVKQLIRILLNENILPIITNIYPNQLYTQLDYEYVQRMNIELNLLNIPCVNVLGTVDALNGKWIEGIYEDGAHPNDFGHGEMRSAFSLSFFENLDKCMHKIIRLNDNVAAFENSKFKIHIDDKIRAFTLVLDFCAANEGEFISFGNNLKLVFSEKNLVLHNASEKICLLQAANEYKKIAVLYHPFTKELTVFYAGEYLIKLSDITADINEFSINSNCCNIKEMCLYRGRLSKMLLEYEFVNNLVVYQSGLEIYSVPNKSGSEKIENMAPTNSFFYIE